MHAEINGLLGLILLILDLWAIISTVSSRAGTGTKVLWVLVVLFLPLLGFLLWLFVGPRGSRVTV